MQLLHILHLSFVTTKILDSVWHVNEEHIKRYVTPFPVFLTNYQLPINQLDGSGLTPEEELCKTGNNASFNLNTTVTSLQRHQGQR